MKMKYFYIFFVNLCHLTIFLISCIMSLIRTLLMNKKSLLCFKFYLNLSNSLKRKSNVCFVYKLKIYILMRMMILNYLY